MGQGNSKTTENDGRQDRVNDQEKSDFYTHPTVNADLVNAKRARQKFSDDRRKRRKWRRKQGYSLPVGFETNSDVEAGGIVGITAYYSGKSTSREGGGSFACSL